MNPAFPTSTTSSVTNAVLGLGFDAALFARKPEIHGRKQVALIVEKMKEKRIPWDKDMVQQELNVDLSRDEVC